MVLIHRLRTRIRAAVHKFAIPEELLVDRQLLKLSAGGMFPINLSR